MCLKASFGHTEPTAGLLGVLRALCAEACAANAQLRRPNPHVLTVVAPNERLPTQRMTMACHALTRGVSAARQRHHRARASRRGLPMSGP